LLKRSSCGADFENRLYRAAIALILDGAIDVVEWMEADVPIERKPSLRVQVAREWLSTIRAAASARS
jgi:hypothetical protein